jgi:saccharopine dehydrogenase-like NADP-dependent oxidoreductase
MKKVLILGAGMVSKPIINYLLKSNFIVTVASPMKERADEIIDGHPLGTSIDWSMESVGRLDEMTADHDITVSLLPYRFHTGVAKSCLKNRKPLVTTSYVQPGIQALDSEAKDAGVIILNEIGLDPGIDHMSAMRIIDHIHNSGGKIRKFYSLCGALPAPEAADNPLKYKFSWSPKGVILASRNSALYLKDGKKVQIDPVNLFRDIFSVDFHGIGKLEVYPNRDSISYIDIYGIPEVSTMYRGTFRYPGWCETLDFMKKINLLDDTFADYTGKTFSGFLAERAGIANNNLRHTLINKFGLSEDSIPLVSLDVLGFFIDEILEYGVTSAFEIVSDMMIEKMSLRRDERDMVVLQHNFLASYPDGRKEVIKSSMLDFGSMSADTAISRTVALPAAIAVKLILEKKIELTGVHRPVKPEIYDPVLDDLKKLGIEMKEEFGLPEDAIANL